MWWTKPKLSQKQRLLNLLKASKYGATSRQMWDLGIFRYSARIADLRDDGYNIKCFRVKGTLFKYYLVKPGKKFKLKYEEVK